MSCGQGVEPTRSGEYRKNGQVWIDQKNGAVIRRFVGYDRYAGPRVRSSLPASWGWPSRLKLSSRCEATRLHNVIGGVRLGALLVSGACFIAALTPAVRRGEFSLAKA